ncbi:MAG: hypothetical protein P9L92_03905 [Candidatus Electryonea clarkiae]|nr:hypothetical protein [Candidatus Electryonea clarkiae]
MTSKCSHRKDCYFYVSHKCNPSALKKGWIKNFCHNSTNAADCSRIKFHRENGIIPPPDIGPTGEAVIITKPL